MKTLFLAFVLVTIAFFTSTNANPSFIRIKASKDLINKICIRTNNPPLCFQVLNSDPRTPGASLKDLGTISLDSVEPHSKASQKLVQSLLQKATDPKLKVQYKSCLGNYNEAVQDLVQGRKALNAGNFKFLGSYASAAYASAQYCDEVFVGSSTPETPELKRANEKLRDLSSITIVVSAFLLLPPSH